MNTIQRNLQNVVIVLSFVALFCLYLALIFKQPYSDRSLIGNFDPFPDTFHYVVPARNLLQGRGFTLERLGKPIGIAVPPLYSISLLPAYVVNIDARSYYWANVGLGVLGVALLTLLLRKTTRSWLLTWFGAFLYVTSYAVYWMPMFAMAENLLLLLVIANLLAFLLPFRVRYLVLQTILAVSLYGTKYAAIPLTLVFLAVAFLKVVLQAKKRNWRLIGRQWLVIVLTAAVMMVLLRGNTLLSAFSSQVLGQAPATQQRYFSPTHITTSFPAYVQILLGVPWRNFWSDHRMVPPLLTLLVSGWSVYFGLIKRRSLPLLIGALVVAQLAFMSCIEMIETRYLYGLIPILILGLTLAFKDITSLFPKKGMRQLVLIGLVTAFSIWQLVLAAPDLKLQLLVNRHGSEIAWWHVGIKETEQLLRPLLGNKPVLVISVLPPYLWDFYVDPGSGISIVPLSSRNYFSWSDVWAIKEPAARWTPEGYVELAKDYDLYIATSGFTGGDWQTFEAYRQAFQLDKLASSCNDTCQVFRVKAKN